MLRSEKIDKPTNMSRALPSSKKVHSEQHKQILKQLLKEDANKTCVDCKTSAHPRWASWNLGCFICIRCSGIHRSMGVHISKVKSVDLDAWTDEQVELMVKWGNAKCNSYWEAKLPDNYIPDQLKIENFIRTKYDMKKWVASATVPNPLSIKQTQEKPIEKPKNNKSTPTVSSAGGLGNLLDDDFGSFTSASTPAVHTKPPVPSKSTVASKPTVNTTRTTSNSRASPIVSSPQTTGGSMSGRPDLKKSILSLYSSPSSSNSSFIQPRQSAYSAPQTPPAEPNALANSLQGLNFGTSTNNNVSMNSNGTNSANSYSSASSSTINNNWNNEWSDTKPITPVNGLKTDLDDDLFKNVWK